MANKYVYLIRDSRKYESDSSKNFSIISRGFSSLVKAKDYLKFWHELESESFMRNGYDENDIDHWADFRDHGYFSFVNIKNGDELRCLSIERVILF